MPFSRARLTHYVMVAALAALAFIAACVAHQVVGQGGMCLATDGEITYLNSVYFSCWHDGPLVAVAGPLANLAVGAVCWWVLRRRPPRSIPARRLLGLALGFNLFWATGSLLTSALVNQGDWAYVLRLLALEPRWLWRCLLGVVGLVLYDRAVDLLARYLPPSTPLVLSVCAAAAVSGLAVLCATGPVRQLLLPVLRDAGVETFAAGAGLLLLADRRRRLDPSREPAPELVPLRRGWLVASALITILFLITLGYGFGSHGMLWFWAP